MDSVRDRVKLVLERTGWSQRELARRAGLPSKSHVSLILTKLGENVRPETLRAIAKASGVSEAWLLTGNGSPDGLPTPPADPQVEREPLPAYSEGEAPLNFNLPNWDALVAGALALEEARAVPECFIEIVGYDNGLLTGPLRPADVLKLAKLTAEYRTAGEVEAMLVTLRAKHGRPPLRRKAEAVPSKPRAVKPVKAGGGEG